MTPVDLVIEIVLVGIICVLVYSWQKSRLEIMEKDMQIKMHNMYDDAFLELLQLIRTRQHDFQNHINAIYSQHYTCATYEQLVDKHKEYCEVIESENQYNKLLNAGNSIIIGFLYGKFMKANEDNIAIQYNIHVHELKSEVPVHKIIEIIGNLFDNAVDAVRNNVLCKKISIDIIEEAGKINISIKNPSKYLTPMDIENMFQFGNSSKGVLRGIGLYNVKTICSQYNCFLNITNKDIDNTNWIIFDIII